MKRILLFENERLLLEITKDLKQYLPHLEQVKKSYENLQLGNFSNEILKEIVNSGTGHIEKIYNESLNDQIEKSGVSNMIVKENMLKGSEVLFFEFLEKTRLLKKFRPETHSRQNYLKLNVISFKNGGFILTDENKEQITENECRIYLENEKEVELHENLKNLIDAYKKVNDNLNELGFRFSYEKGKGFKGIENTFLNPDVNNNYSIIPASIRFAVNFKENELKYNN